MYHAAQRRYSIIHIQLPERYRRSRIFPMKYYYTLRIYMAHILKREEHSAEKTQSLSLMRKTKSKHHNQEPLCEGVSAAFIC